MPRPLLDRRAFVRFGALSGAGALLAGCRPSRPAQPPPAAPPPRQRVTMTRDRQQALTPREVVDLLKAGNARFVRGERQDRDYLHDRAATAGGQHPAAAVLSCIDSRAPAEIVLDAGIGDMFNARIAGNFVDRDLAGSLEFACALAGAKVLLVLGHTRCGAIKGAIEGARLGNLTALLEKLTPAVRAVREAPGPRSAKNDAFVDAVAAENVRLTVRELRRISPVLAGLEREGRLLLVGAMYRVDSGAVDFLS